ncbi:SpoVR family protein [Chitinispirillales bacterium ANBcel5]|uniref:SpoVR family protein n=1 Tax=Cellulosispirillum alkaliphilum TaxID=3039283 RepID=UPI002A507D1B|nr:SpoVR family protein [Chitinispirillales bacterium ANBcel5]
MELINQKTKKIMEGCKERAYDAGLRFGNETLEYIVTNRDLIELTPKLMIPTMYDYWVHDVEVLKEKGRYELYPNNPYETVINTRPAISFYNDNNPDWMNVMIFYHVLAHVDFFQNNQFFRNTWDYDFTGQALSDKRMISNLRSEKGRWVDYIIEFARAIDNLVGYHNELSRYDGMAQDSITVLDYYFDVFLQKVKKVPLSEYIKEVERYNKCLGDSPSVVEQVFFADVQQRFPEFTSNYERYVSVRKDGKQDIMQYILNNSESLNRGKNKWMKSIIEVVRKTSLFFQPQIRTKIMNEGWASYWHENLFLSDDRIKGHEVDFAKLHAGIASMPRVGLNPYALGIRIFQYIEELGDKGKYSMAYDKLSNRKERNDFDASEGRGRELIYDVCRNLSDSLFIDTFVDQEFVNKHNLFVAGKKLNQSRMVWEYYVKSRKAEQYRQMLQEQLYHPPYITVDMDRNANDVLYLYHHFEQKPLVNEYISNVLLGIEFLWGGPVQLETSEVDKNTKSVGFGRSVRRTDNGNSDKERRWQRVLYTMKDRKLSRKVLT